MTFIAEGLSLRVNGQDCDTIYLRPALVDGVFTDPEVLLWENIGTKTCEPAISRSLESFQCAA